MRKMEKIMEEPKLNEKEEKEVSKHEEKSYEEKWQRDPVSAISWALFLIWAGVVLLLYNLDQLSFFSNFVEGLNLPFAELPFDIPFFNIEAWQVFFLGAALIVTLEVIVRLLFPTYRRSIVGSVIWAGVLFGLAFGNWEVVFPAMVIVAGLVILLGSLTKRR
jgi:hypothetical protein